MTKEEFRDYVEILRSQDEISYDVYSGLIDGIDTLEQDQKIGHWTRELIRNEKGGCIGAKMLCSECGNDNKHDEYMNYCPNCGCKMVKPQESEVSDADSY